MRLPKKLLGLNGDIMGIPWGCKMMYPTTYNSYNVIVFFENRRVILDPWRAKFGVPHVHRIRGSLEEEKSGTYHLGSFTAHVYCNVYVVPTTTNETTKQGIV